LQEAAHHVTDGGRIISISTFGTRSLFLGGAAHLGAKAAGEQFVRALPMELGPRGITVNTVSPWYTDTNMLVDDKLRRMGQQMSPLGRLGSPDDITYVVAFLVSEQGRWITGQNIQAGGGVVMT